MAKEITDQARAAGTDQLKKQLRGLAGALGERAVGSVSDKVGGATDRLTEYAERGGPGLTAALTGGRKLAEGKSPVSAALGAGVTGAKEKVTGALSSLGGGGDGGGKTKVKMTNIVETIDIGVPVTVAYNQWTQFADFPTYMKKVESVEQEAAERLNWRAQIFWSHRSWQSTITEQVPDRRIVWRSEGEKGKVDGAVTFHELAPELTRILVVMEYHPQGFFERTGNMWRAQGRRTRLELKHFRRHVMTKTVLHPDQVSGWRGEIRDGEVVRQHEEGEEAETREEPGAPSDDGRADDGKADDELGEDELGEDEPLDEVDDEVREDEQDEGDSEERGEHEDAGTDDSHQGEEGSEPRRRRAPSRESRRSRRPARQTSS